MKKPNYSDDPEDENLPSKYAHLAKGPVAFGMGDAFPPKPASPKRTPPAWVGPSLAAAQHFDNLNYGPRWKRILHRIFISKRCPACQYAKALKWKLRWW